MPRLTQEDALAEVIAAMTRNPIRPDKSFTTEELAERSGHAVEWARGHLKRLRKDGRLESVKILKESISGVLMPVPGYRILAGKK